ncbi:MAG: thioredoxin [Desulfobacterales bacterium]|nr:thioredoxin [Desulfobacterales bacterium]MDD4070857.1 thioredoxin [Desulfobacterales bacterium]MDD4391260.1 thioredoxin [Desulfobacterales bacterium]
MGQINPYIIRCSHCGTRNRIAAENLKRVATCGQCGTILRTDYLLIDQPVIVTDSEFESLVLRSPLPALLDCWAPWCGACRTLSPVIDELSQQLKGRVRVCKLNVDQHAMTASLFKIKSIPTLLIFDNGQLKDTIVGGVPKQQILQKLTPYF